MKIGWALPELEPRDNQKLYLATHRDSFRQAVTEIRDSHGIKPAKTWRLWLRVRRTLKSLPQICRNLSSKLPFPLSRYSQKLLDFEIRTSLYYGTGYDWSRGQRLVIPNWSDAQRSLIRKNFSRPPGAPRLEIKLTKNQQRFSRDLKTWFDYCSPISAHDIERLRQSSGLIHLWSVLWLEHLLFNTPLERLPTVSPRAGFDILWEGEFLYALIYRNTTIRDIKKAPSSPLGKPFLTHAARLINPLMKIPPPRIIRREEWLKVGPLPSVGASEVLVKLWPQIQVKQKNLLGLEHFREKPYFDRDIEANKLRTQGLSAPEITERIKKTDLAQYFSSEAVRMSLYRQRQHLK